MAFKSNFSTNAAEEALLASKQQVQERKQEVQKIVEQNRAAGTNQQSAREPYKTEVSETFSSGRTVPALTTGADTASAYYPAAYQAAAERERDLLAAQDIAKANEQAWLDAWSKNDLVGMRLAQTAQSQGKAAAPLRKDIPSIEQLTELLRPLAKNAYTPDHFESSFLASGIAKERADAQRSKDRITQSIDNLTKQMQGIVDQAKGTRRSVTQGEQETLNALNQQRDTLYDRYGALDSLSRAGTNDVADLVRIYQQGYRNPIKESVYTGAASTGTGLTKVGEQYAQISQRALLNAINSVAESASAKKEPLTAEQTVKQAKTELDSARARYNASRGVASQEARNILLQEYDDAYQAYKDAKWELDLEKHAEKSKAMQYFGVTGQGLNTGYQQIGKPIYGLLRMGKDIVDNVVELFGGEAKENNLDKFIDDSLAAIDQHAQQAQKVAAQTGTGAELVLNTTQALVSMLPYTLLALATGGTSAAGNIVAAGGTNAAIAGSSGAKAIAGSAGRAMQSALTNPTWLYGYASMLGGEYADLRAEGMSEAEASLAAFMSAFLGASVEVAGGIQKLPDNPNAMRAWVKSFLLEEPSEEVVQDIISDLARAAIDFDDGGEIAQSLDWDSEQWQDWARNNLVPYVQEKFITYLSTIPAAAIGGAPVAINAARNTPQTARQAEEAQILQPRVYNRQFYMTPVDKALTGQQTQNSIPEQSFSPMFPRAYQPAENALQEQVQQDAQTLVDAQNVAQNRETTAEGGGKRYKVTTAPTTDTQQSAVQTTDVLEAAQDVKQAKAQKQATVERDGEALLKTIKPEQDVLITGTAETSSDKRIRTEAFKEGAKEQRAKDKAAQDKKKSFEKLTKELEKNAKLVKAPMGTRGIPDSLVEVANSAYNALESITEHEFKGDKRNVKAIRRALSQSLAGVEAMTAEKNRVITDINGKPMLRVEAEHSENIVALDEEVETLIKDTVATLQGIEDGVVDAKEFTKEDFDRVRDCFKAIRKAIKDRNKVLGQEKQKTVSELREQGIGELKASQSNLRGKAPVNNRLGGMLTYEVMDLETLDTAIGSDAVSSVVKPLLKGQENAFAKIKSAQQATQQMFEKRGVSGDDVLRWNKEMHSIKLQNGETVSMSTAQLMNLYLLNKREQARLHIFGDGIRIAKIKGALGLKKGGGRASQLTAKDVDNMVSDRYLTKQQRDLADDMQKYIAGEVSTWYNKVWLSLYDMRMITDPNYWMINASDSISYTEKKKQQANLGGGSATKAVSQKARNAITVDSIFDVYSAYVQKSAYYAETKVMFNDIKKVINSKDASGDSILTTIRTVRGEAAEKALRDLLDTVGGAIGETDHNGDISSALLNLYKGGAVVGNLRMTVQQPTSLPRAFAEISPRDWAAGLSKANIKEMQEHSSLAWWKSESGGTDVQRSRGTRELILGTKTTGQKVSDAGMWAAGKLDDITWAQIWGASKAYVERTNKTVRVGSDRYWELVNDKFSDVINKTQVIDTPLHRGAHMRSQNPVSKMSTAFMSEPTKVYNMMQRAIITAIDNPTSENKAKAFRSVVATAASIAFNAAMTAGYDTLGGDDDEDKLKQFTDNYWEDLKQGLNPFSFHWATDMLYDLVTEQYGATERMDLAGLKSLVSAIGDVAEWAKTGYSKKTPYVLITNLLKPFMGGAIRSGETIYNAISPENIKKKRDTATLSGAYKAIYELAAVGDSEGAMQLEGRLMEESEREEGLNIFGFSIKSQEEIDSGLAQVVFEQDAENLKKLYELTSKGKASEAQKLIESMTNDAVTQDVIAKALKKYQNSIKTDEDKGESKPKDNSIYSNKNAAQAFVNGVESGNYDDFNIMRDDLIRVSTASEPEDAVNENIRGEIKAMYVDLYNKDDQTGLKKLGNAVKKEFGITDETLDGWIASQIKASDGTALKTASQLEAFEKVDGENSKNRDELIHVMSGLSSITGTPSGEKTEKGADKMIEGTQGLNQFKHIADSKLTLEEQLAVMESIGNQEGLYKRVKQAVDGGVDVDDYLTIETKLRTAKDNSDGYRYLAELDAKGDTDTMAAVMMSVGQLGSYNDKLYDRYTAVAKTGKTPAEREWLGDTYLNVMATCTEGDKTPNSQKAVAAALKPYLSDSRMSGEAFMAIVQGVCGEDSQFAARYQYAKDYCTPAQWAYLYEHECDSKKEIQAACKELGISKYYNKIYYARKETYKDLVAGN